MLGVFAIALLLPAIPIYASDGTVAAAGFGAGTLALSIVLGAGLRRIERKHAPAPVPEDELAQEYLVGFGLGAAAMVLTWAGTGALVDGAPYVGIPILVVLAAVVIWALIGRRAR